MENEKKAKIIVFHPMQQHSYKTAEALIESNMLYSYCTSIYYNPKKFIYKLLQLFLSKKEKHKMYNRKNTELDDYVKIFSSFWGFLYLIIQRIDKTKDSKFIGKMQQILSEKSGKKVAKYAIKNNIDIIIGYDTWSFAAIKELKKRKSNIKFIIDYTSLYAEEIINIINQDIKNNPESIKYYNKQLTKFNSKYLKKYQYEKNNTDFIFSPSKVVDESLLKYSVDAKKIIRCTYGTYFTQQSRIKEINNKIVFTYVGKISYAKGCHYLISAFEKIKRKDYLLQLVGYNTDNFIFNTENENIKYLGVMPHDKIPEILKNTDIFVTESLYDGFPLSILEAFSYNIPVICTDKTGIKDYIINEKNGYIINICDSQELIDKVLYLLENKDKINEIKQNVRDSIKDLTWEKYNKDVNNGISKILNLKEIKKKII